MRVPYLVGRARTPQPSLGGSLLRPRPILAVRVIGPRSSLLRDGLLETGADDTVFPDWVATLVGLDPAKAEARDIGLAGRKPVTYRKNIDKLALT